MTERICRQPWPRSTAISGVLTISSNGLAENLDGQANSCAKAAQGAVVQHKIAAMGADDIARDGKTQPRSAALQIAALVQPVKRTEGFFPAFRGYTRAVVVHRDVNITAVALHGHGHMRAVL